MVCILYPENLNGVWLENICVTRKQGSQILIAISYIVDFSDS